jgi:hypothetical protein
MNNLHKTNQLKHSLLIILLTISNIIAAQNGWNGKALIPLHQFVDKANWTINFQRNTGDTSFVTTDDSCVYLHWKFGPGKRYKYAQCYQYLGTPISLLNKDIIGLDVKGSKCKPNRSFQIKFEDGTNQTNYRWDGLAGITRWCERISALKKQFYNNVGVNWSTISVISFEVNSEMSDNDVASDSGVVAFRKLLCDSISSWTRANTYESLKDSSILPNIAREALKAILNRQNSNTGLFYTWHQDQSSYLYGQGLVLKILSGEGKWKNSEPIDSCARAAEKLAIFLINHQDKLGFWPRAWHTQTGEILQNLENDGTIWMGDFPWIITGLQNYYKKSGDVRVKISIDKAKSFLYNLIDNDSIFYTINPNTQTKFAVTSGEAYAAAILSVQELGDSIKADRMLNYIDHKTWDNELLYWKESLYSPRITLFANTWLALLSKQTSHQKSLNALTFAGKALYTKGPGEPPGFDGIGPVATWFEGTLSYICAGGIGSNAIFYNLLKYRYADGSVPHYNDSVSVVGVWAVKWSSLDGTSWLYYAASKKSPFDLNTALKPIPEQPKKVLIHYLGWFGDSLATNDNKLRHWNCGGAHNPLIGQYDSRSWSLLMYHILLSWSCGIDGMVINMKDEYDDQCLKKLIPTIKRIRNIDSLRFQYDFAISYDDQGFDKKSPLDTAITKFTYLRDDILPNTNNYLHYYDKPAVFVFNYSYAFLSANDYQNTINNLFPLKKPMLLWNSLNGIEDSTKYVDAYYPWVQPGEPNFGWNGTNWGKPYLNYFYEHINYLNTTSSKLNFTCGGVWPGFDERKNNCWSNKTRLMERRNGVVYDSTWSFVHNYQQPLPLKWVVIETWNDWNEGTEIEPSKESGYQYIKSTIDHINTFKNLSISKDTCKFEAARKIYLAADMIEHQQRDSTIDYPLLLRAIKSLLLNNCNQAISAADSIILKRRQAITLDSIPIKTYGDIAFSLNASSSLGLPVNYYCSDNAVASISENNKVTINNAGSAIITASQPGNITVLAANTTRSLIVKKALLTVTADNKTRKYGEPNPEFTLTYHDFVNGENESVLDIKPIPVCFADHSTSAGQYDIEVLDGDDNNYDFAYISGKLTVTPTTIDNLKNVGIEIFPNPAKNQLFIKLSEGISATVQICSINGQVKLNKELNNLLETIDVSQLTKGVYMLKIIYKDKVRIFKIVLQ